MKRTITARLYVLDYRDTRHQLTATSAADLAAQVQGVTSSKQTAALARAIWGDEGADLKVGGVRLVAVGAVVRELWRSLPPLKGQQVLEGDQEVQQPVKSTAAVQLGEPPEVAAQERLEEGEKVEVKSEDVDALIQGLGEDWGARDEERAMPSASSPRLLDSDF